MVVRRQSTATAERRDRASARASDSRFTSGGLAAARPRDPRINVSLRGRMQTGECWVDITIHNVSSRGLMAQCDAALERGRYVEIRCGSCVLIGRVVWCGAHRFGLRTMDIIDLARLLGKPNQRLPAARPTETRASASSASRRTATERHAANRHLSRVLQFAWIGSLALAAAFLLAAEVRQLLAKPLGTAAATMGSSNPNSSQTAARRH